MSEIDFSKKLKSLDEGVQYVRKIIENSHNPIMFFDCDSDGATSYLQLKRVFSKISGFPMTKDLLKQKELLNTNLNVDVDLILIFDIPFLFEEFLVLINELNPNCKIVWVDHHPTNSKELIQKYNIFNLNPLDFDETDNRPACYLSYLISGKHKDNLEFLVLGSVADYFLLDEIFELYGYNKKAFKSLFPKLRKDKRGDLFDFIKHNKFNGEESREKREGWIRYLIYDSGLIKLKNFFDFLFKFKQNSDILKAFNVIEKLSVFDINVEINANKGFVFENYNDLMGKYMLFLKKALINSYDDKLFLFEYCSDLGFTKTLSEEICYRFSNVKVIMICFRKLGKENYTCSFRGNGFVVNELVTKCLSGLDGRGGGHAFASGAIVNAKDFSQFKKRIIKRIDKTLKKTEK